MLPSTITPLDFMRDEDEVRSELARAAARYTSAEDWKARAQVLRAGILRGAGLDPLPPRCPLHPILHSRRKMDGYSVENAAFEALPGFFVTGNLYRPLGMEPPFAGILCPHGHFQGPNGGGRFRDDMQSRCATFARMGAVVFAYDMAGWGDSTQIDHQYPYVLAVQLWSSIRALDFLESLPEVDPTRLAVTGASGGGTQSFMLTAVEDRVAVSVPVVMVSALYAGGCRCESGMPIHKSDSHETNNAEIAACAAPRPQLLLSVGSDWTKRVPELEFPFIRGIYGLFGAEGRVENVHFADEEHDYGPSKRAAVYAFLARHLGMSLDRAFSADGVLDESAVTILPQDDLRVFPDSHPRPAGAIASATELTGILFPPR